MSVTIKVSGISEELLAELDKRVLENHMTSRSEYIRQVLREVLSQRGADAVNPDVLERQAKLNAFFSKVKKVNIPFESENWSREIIYED